VFKEGKNRPLKYLGEHGESFYVILKGSVSVGIPNKNEKPSELAKNVKNDLEVGIINSIFQSKL
jgi:CRP-like cAMP-binding protein